MKVYRVLEDIHVELNNIKYNISDDNNLGIIETKITHRLLSKLHAWQESVGAKMPAVNNNFK